MSHRSRERHFLWLAAVATSLTGAIAYAHSFSRFDEWTLIRPLSFFAIGIGMLGIVFCAPRWRSRKTEVAILLGLALALRVALLPTPPSDDIHRYLWEGKLVAEGINPYALRGDHIDLTPHRDEYWEQMNNKDKPTAYPPASLIIFGILSSLSYTTWSFKIAFLAADLLVVVLILQCLHYRKLPLRNVSFYAFNPVTLIAFAGEAHFDALMLVGLVASFIFMDRKAWILAGGTLGFAVQVKFMALLALPILLWNGRWRASGAFVITILLLSLPFRSSLPQLFDALYQFGALRDFNGLPNLFGNALNLTREAIHRPVQILFALCFLYRLIRYRGKDDWHKHWLWMISSLLLLAPTVHFWYLTWIAISLPFAPSLFWISLSITQGLYFLVWKNYADSENWDLLDFQSALLWSPVFILGLPYAVIMFQSLKRYAFSKRIPISTVEPGDDSLLVVIPTLNASKTLLNCLDHVLPQLRSHDKIVLSDANSSDDTALIARRENIPLVIAPQGRGEQILSGLSYSPSRYALILHADTTLCEGTLETLLAHLKRNPQTVGGALGQRFPSRGLLPYRLVEILNELRSSLWGVSFGDQSQFFDRSKFRDCDFPDQPLMEDIELSNRLRETGDLVYLGTENLTDSRKWKNKPSVRFMLVLRIVANYSLQRNLSSKRAKALAVRLYELYYGKSKPSSSE